MLLLNHKKNEIFEIVLEQDAPASLNVASISPFIASYQFSSAIEFAVSKEPSRKVREAQQQETRLLRI
jgi:hypothetical protein